MALKIRLRKQGRKNRPFFRLVLINERTARDGKYVEGLGWYNPLAVEGAPVFEIKEERVKHWLELGAQMSERAKNLVAKGAPTAHRYNVEKIVEKREKRAKKRREKRREKASK
jgi:small subunit ribosomal protein S16